MLGSSRTQLTPARVILDARNADFCCSRCQRVGTRIRECLDDCLRTAVRRGIIENSRDGLRPLCRGIADYELEFLVEQLVAGMGRTWWDRDELIVATARWLGYRRAGAVIRDTLKGAITSAIRRGRLERDDRRRGRRCD